MSASFVLAAGGTGGHLFPAEALGVVLMQRGLRVRLVTDSRAIQYSGLFSEGGFDVVPSETIRGNSPLSLLTNTASGRSSAMACIISTLAFARCRTAVTKARSSRHCSFHTPSSGRA